ncbi:hypothetical protein GDO78_016306 [Eleutherodactylus coqui]|uniref:Taste receptor type 2 n=1 Tax=Eleutherodactylus coqui TaxID=57060 RepID=A0A8J6BG86_ELECQ|nr:hypothetical protein GDO78_016306 [Eleutherodactylus coqui]
MVNAFIIVMNVLDWLDSRKMKPYDKLMMSLGLSRVFLLLCFLFRIINRVGELNAYTCHIARWIFRTAQLFFDFSSLWFAMWLCVLYYVKIGIFKNTLLLRFKLSIPQTILPIILTSSVISFSFGFVFAFNIKETSDVMDSVYVPINESSSRSLKFVLPSYCFGHFIPFIIGSISKFLLIETFSVHIQHIKKNLTSFTSPNLDVHIFALRYVCLLQFMNICNLISTVLFHFNLSEGMNRNVFFLILNFYPTLHSVALIYGNLKLKRAFCGILDRIQECCKMKIPSSIHHIERKTETIIQQK